MDGEEFCLDCHCQMKYNGGTVNLFELVHGEVSGVKRGSLMVCPKCKKTIFSYAGQWILQHHNQSDEDWLEQVESFKQENIKKGQTALLYIGE